MTSTLASCTVCGAPCACAAGMAEEVARAAAIASSGETRIEGLLCTRANDVRINVALPRVVAGYLSKKSRYVVPPQKSHWRTVDGTAPSAHPASRPSQLRKLFLRRAPLQAQLL